MEFLPDLFYTPVLRAQTKLLGWKKVAEEREIKGGFGAGEFFLSATFHPCMISEKPRLLWENLASTISGVYCSKAERGRQDTVYKQLGIERPPAPHPLPAPPLTQDPQADLSSALLAPQASRASRTPASRDQQVRGASPGQNFQVKLWVHQALSLVVRIVSSQANQTWIPILLCWLLAA